MLATTLSSENRAVSDKPVDNEVGLIRAVADGDRVAFEKIFRMYHPRIYKFSLRMLQDHQLAEEVACDTLYAVWTSASRFREQSAVSTWILGIAYRRSLKSYNRNARHINNREPAYSLEELVEHSPSVNPETYTNNAMQGKQLQAALSTLSSNHRAVIELAALGHSCGEIANIVGCPENTVKSRTFHARRQLRSAFQE